MRSAIFAIPGLIMLVTPQSPARTEPVEAGPPYWTIEEALANSPEPWPSQSVGDELMFAYGDDPSFVDAELISPDRVHVYIKDVTERTELVSGVTVDFVSLDYTLADFKQFAGEVRDQNPLVHGVVFKFADQTLEALLPIDAIGEGVKLDTGGIPDDIAVTVLFEEAEVLDAAEGGRTVTGNGCTSGFRMNGHRISTANHCDDVWGDVNGTAVTHRSNKCSIDNQWGSASSIGLTIRGYFFSGIQGNPSANSLVWKYGRMTGWTYGYRRDYANAGISCDVLVFKYNGGTIQSVSGDSGGPYVTFSGSNYIPRGTHRGSGGSFIHSIPIGEINRAGWNVG
jgi:hypothetical protein